jgi:hypothetical protein
MVDVSKFNPVIESYRFTHSSFFQLLLKINVDNEQKDEALHQMITMYSYFLCFKKTL